MTPIVKQHFMNPQNIGNVKKPTHQGKAKSGFCGDTVEITARVDNYGIVTDLKYNVFGCYAVIATSSILSEWAIGKHIGELHELEYDDVVEMIGGAVEDGKENCVRTAMEAFKSLV